MVKLGFIGLGIMGSRMAANLQKKSYELIVHNRTKSKAEALLANGATWAETPAELARQVDVLFTMLASPPVVEQVALGRSGFLDQLRQGAIWVDCSTVNPSFSRRMAAEASERGVRFLDAPEAGTKGPAERGELVVLVGGEQADFQACQPFLEAFGRKVINVGGYGMGTSMKMVMNLLLGQAMVAFSEAMALGQTLGIAQEMLFNTLLGGPMVAPFVAGKRAHI